MSQNNTPLTSQTEHPLFSIMTDMSYDLVNSKNVYEIMTVHPDCNWNTKYVTWIIRKKGIRKLFVEKNSFDALLKADRPFRYAPELMRMMFDQVVCINHSIKPLKDGKMDPNATVLYEDESALYLTYAELHAQPSIQH